MRVLVLSWMPNDSSWIWNDSLILFNVCKSFPCKGYPTQDLIHRMFSNAMCNRIFSRGGARVGEHIPQQCGLILSYNNAETGHFLPLLTQKLLKLPRNKVKHRNWTGERSEPRKFLEYECSKPIFGVYFSVFLGNFSVSTFCGPILGGGGQTRIRGGGNAPLAPPPL